MSETDCADRPVNLWYPQSNRARATAGLASCERFPDARLARARAEELIRCGAAMGPVQIEDVESGVIIERISRS